MLKPYHFNIENLTNKHTEIILFGSNEYMLSPNFGNIEGVSIKPVNDECTYIELLGQSAVMPRRSEIFRFITDSWDNMPKELEHRWRDANGFGQPKKINLVTSKWGKYMIPNKAVNDIIMTKTIDGNSVFKISTPPKSKFELIIIEK